MTALVLPQNAAELKTVQVRGVVMPVGEVLRGMRAARIRMESLLSAFSETTQSNGLSGKFSFDAIPEGFYILSVASELGEARRIVDIRSSRSDALGRLDLSISIGKDDGKWDLKRRLTVPASEVSVTKSAKGDYVSAEAFARTRRFDEAIALLERAVRDSPTYVAAWAKLGIIAYHSDRLADAERYLRNGLKHNSADYECLFALGRILMSLDRLQEALRYNKAALQQWPDDALTNAQYGLNLYLVGETKRATECLDYARRLDPENIRNAQFWSQVYPLKRVNDILSGRPRPSK